MGKHTAPESRPAVQIALRCALFLAMLLFLTMLLKHISYPLLWHDESDTVMFGERVLEYGYPKVHGPKNVVYGLKHRLKLGVDERFDAYTGAPWGYYYFASIGVALARGADDLYAKTALLRLPFAAIGSLGLIVLLLGVLDATERDPPHRLVFSILFWASMTYSVSLQLHLREARYYGLIVFLTCALISIFIRHHVFAKLSYRWYVGLGALLLFLIFNTFYPAFVPAGAAIALHAAWGALRGGGSHSERLRRLLRDGLPVILALAAALPLLLFFDFLQQVQGWLDSNDGSLGGYASSLGIVSANLLRYELLAPALVTRLGLLLQLRLVFEAPLPEKLRQRQRIAGFLWLFIACYVLVVSRTPFVWERYFIALSPVVTVTFLLDAFSLYELLRGPVAARGRRWSGVSTATAVVLVLGVNLWVRVPEFRGRIYEIGHRYRGPLDFVIPYLKNRYPHIEDLVIATNYEDPVYMYYLGSQVTVGYYGANLARDLELQPDIIIPRSWSARSKALGALARGAEYTPRRFPVANLKTNNTPGLSALNPGGLVHEFRTRLAREGEPRLLILERSDPEPVREELRLGNARARDGDLEAALGHFRRVAEMAPGSAVPHRRLAEIFVARGNLTAALQHLHEVVRLAPESVPDRILLAHALRKRGDVEAAIAQYRRAAERAPAPLRRDLAKELRALGALEDANDLLRDASGAEPHGAQAR